MTTRVATAAGAGPDTRFFIPFTKVEENSDGSVYVEGVATAEVLDFHGEVVSYEASKAAFKEWSDWAEKATDGASIGNIREMHQPVVAGRAVKWWADDTTRSIHLGATIEDPTAAKLCRSRAYTGYSIGGGDVKREMQPWEGKSVPWITAYRLSENSIVDKPACPTATFTLVKRATKEIAAMKPIEFLKTHLSAVLLCAAAMPEKDTLKIGDETIAIVGTPEIPVLELRKDANSAIVAGDEALAALKKFMVEVLGMDGDPDLWTIGDICEAMRYCYSARMGAQYSAANAEGEVAASAGVVPKLAFGDRVVSTIYKESSEEPVAWIVKRASGKTERVLPTDTNIVTKSDTPAEEETEVSELPVKEEVAPEPKAPEPSPAVPPAEPEPEKQAAVDLSPVLDAIAKLAASIEPTVKALLEGGLAKAAGAQDLTQLAADVATIKKAIESLPAPPAGRPALKSIGSFGSGSGELTPEAMEKVVEVLEQSGRLEHADRVKLRVALATATIQLGQQQR